MQQNRDTKRLKCLSFSIHIACRQRSQMVVLVHLNAQLRELGALTAGD